MTENACPYCKDAGVQMLPVRVAKPDEKGLVEERLGARVLIESIVGSAWARGSLHFRSGEQGIWF